MYTIDICSNMTRLPLYHDILPLPSCRTLTLPKKKTDRSVNNFFRRATALKPTFAPIYLNASLIFQKSAIIHHFLCKGFMLKKAGFVLSVLFSCSNSDMHCRKYVYLNLNSKMKNITILNLSFFMQSILDLLQSQIIKARSILAKY